MVRWFLERNPIDKGNIHIQKVARRDGSLPALKP
jgi:hypothetical protein